MTIAYYKILSSPQVRPYLFQARFGLEREGHRVDAVGHLSGLNHPAALGSRNFHPYLQTDFSETQLEAITPVFEDSKHALQFMEALHDVMIRSLEQGELLWSQSMPPALPENESDIRLANLEKKEDVLYREGLAEKYGKRKQMVSGIHYNFEFGKDLLQAMWKQQQMVDFQTFKSEIYMKLSRQYLRYMWLITYCLGGSPRANAGFFTDKAEKPKEPVRSIRNSKFGYRNTSDIFVSYRNLEQYYEDLHTYVKTGALSEMKEFYSAVRLRGGKRAEELLDVGVQYVEFRNFDLNPFVRVGMDEDTARFVHLFALYLIYKEEEETPEADQRLGYEINDAVALENSLEKTAYFNEGKLFFAQMRTFAQNLDFSKDDLALIDKFAQMLEKPETTMAGQMELAYRQNKTFALDLSRQYRQQSYKRPFQLAGFTHLELSTQNLLFDAIQKGLKVEVLDEHDQMVALSYKSHREIIEKGNMTSKDSMVAYAVMENKVVTKKLLNRVHLNTPQGQEFSDLETAQAAFPLFETTSIVVKPKSTNYGLGISIFKQPATQEQFYKALEIAFREDKEVLVERFVSGTEYRFFVLDGKTRAVLRRDAAHVIGDGVSTISQLVAQKNENPLRGHNHRFPLEKIQITATEKLMLDVRGYTEQSIPEKDVKVNLRENSNVSTGGDSIDVTDEMPEIYKNIAEKAAEALQVKITGVDILIEDLNDSLGEKYSIIEANFNPAMLFHLYPLKGKGRRVTMDVLQFLFPEIFA
ncbi:bifunctional glutamate--cysteine ligase GshA/glutathione synthetase GshB [Lactococcus formosensis]|uniref:bifunctional glutamate--cysteine ligase GshA/glutathione synthetase GshB n=1 Tax=Lactococcus formosensis TaxID=1281486 RepID=UPI002435AC4C|nr:bifunctional glutamate--cysteine ligase GshA/glutathione synthetase GshB [Lactococcus formosensis]MDG6113327.1 bifunctional glutamate--cysteine ligase GshA/glutathione synthetase GshB [Lactococcus formosensis]MDG6116560.1 bifunctional glutamate--cysteine ligase GshA/glutathione synthetase GshB [Lactococcus formosensis]MDG6121562.1 bifunctional glutamate--cysteine ligase GshA/glutathione synthetase GshB [Lactococcus formosensis]MDG6123124.1 bifunctional glutamate--cysteine ligase GshA/glutath